MSLCVEPYLRASACRIRDLTIRSTVQQPGNGLFHALAIGFPHAPFTIEASRLQSLEQVDGCRNGYLSAAVRQVYVSAHSTKMPPAFALLLRAMRNYGDIRQATNINQ